MLADMCQFPKPVEQFFETFVEVCPVRANYVSADSLKCCYRLIPAISPNSRYFAEELPRFRGIAIDKKHGFDIQETEFSFRFSLDLLLHEITTDCFSS